MAKKRSTSTRRARPTRLAGDRLASLAATFLVPEVAVPSSAAPTPNAHGAVAGVAPLGPTIVGIGASGDCIDALVAFVKALPASKCVSYVAVLRDSSAARISSSFLPTLRKATTLRVLPATDGAPLGAATLHVAGVEDRVTVADGRLHLEPPSSDRSGPIDHLLESLASEGAERSIAVLLEGAGVDGAVGVRAIKDLGGLVLVQDPATAEVPDLPHTTIATSLVDEAAPLRVLARRILARADAIQTTPNRGSIPPAAGASQRAARAGMNGARARSISAPEPATVTGVVETALSKDGLFADADAWAALRERVLEPLLRNRPASVPLRVWVPECATGENAYTIAIMIEETLRGLEIKPPVKIFATDADESALKSARVGSFDQSDIEHLPPLLRQYFEFEDDRRRALRRLRETVLFAHHHLLRDPPYSHLDLIVSRGLLTELDAPSQKRVLKIFHRSLSGGGTLFLGSTDTVGAQRPDLLFDAIDRRFRIFRAAGSHRRRVPLASLLTSPVGAPRESALRLTQRLDYRQLLRQTLLERYAPASVLIDHERRVLHYHADTGEYLSPPDGEPTAGLLAMLSPDLARDVAIAVDRAIDEEATVRVRAEDHARDPRGRVLVTVTPVEPATTPALLVVSFAREQSEERLTGIDRRPGRGERVLVGAATAPPDAASYRVEHRDREHREAMAEANASNEQLRVLIDDLRTANEELESSREELQSMNDELQESNERVTLINRELQESIGELERSSSDLINLLDGTDVATVFLDREGLIRRFTSAVHGLISLRPHDVGRPIGHFAVALDDPTLFLDVNRVLATSHPAESVARGQGDRWFLRRVVPYRTSDGTVDGVVLTFTDITLRHQAQELLRQVNEDLEETVKSRTSLVRLLQDTAVIANNATPTERAFAATIERVCRDFPWIGGHVYLMSNGIAEDSRVWHVKRRGARERIRSQLGGRSFAPGEGLVGEVVADGVARWSSDLGSDERFATPEAEALDIKAVLVFPILIGERIAGVFEFFSDEVGDPGPGQLEVMRNVGTQLGRVIERDEARARVFDLAVEEQRSLGEELHDTLSQQVHGLSMLAQSMVKTLAGAGIDDERVRALVEGLVDTHRQIRQLSSGLVPVRVEGSGLAGALAEMAAEWEQMHGVACVFEHEGNGGPDDERVATAVYRIAREAARNAVIHGAAEHIVIRLADDEEKLELAVHDDGQGMAVVPEGGPGMGLQIMRHRAEQIGGTLDIESTPGIGTVVRCKIDSNRARVAGSQL